VPIEEKTRERLEPLVLGRMRKLTYDQIAEQTGVSVRTLKRWAATSDFATLFRETQAENRKTAHARATLWADDILGVLYQLAMTDGRSQLVRYHAAAKLADILGLGQDPEDRGDASGEELAELYAVLRRAKERARADPGAYAPRAVGPADTLPYEAIELKRPVLPVPAVAHVGETEELDEPVDAEFEEVPG
jgi:hypothetical protein